MKRTRLRSISNHRKRELADYARVRAIVAIRDGQVCVKCGEPAVDSAHIIPRSHFGRKRKRLCHTLKNVCCLCRDCHAATENRDGRIELMCILHDRHGYDYSMEPWKEYWVDTERTDGTGEAGADST